MKNSRALILIRLAAFHPLGRQLGEMAGELHDLGVLHALHHRQHQLGLAQLFAEQDQLGLDEELRLPGDRRDLRVRRIAVGAV